MTYSGERNFFASFRDGLQGDPALANEVVGAIRDLLTRYGTTVWENRFIVGGAIEQIVGSAGRALGITVDNTGKANQGYDLELPGGQPISLKALLSTLGRINLVNVRGSGTGASWNTATIFIIRGEGIGYADPQLLPATAYFTGDAICIDYQSLADFWNNNTEYFINVDIPRNPSAPATRVASDAVAFDIFANYSRLSKHFKPER